MLSLNYGCDAGVTGKKVVTVERKRETVVFLKTKEVERAAVVPTDTFSALNLSIHY